MIFNRFCLQSVSNYHIIKKMEIENLLSRIKSGDSVALSRAISIVENNRKGADKILSCAYFSEHKAIKVGITGAPGSGKSSLIARLIFALRQLQKRVAVLAIDPTSPISGGAILGDRIRMNHLTNDPDVFIRSLASRGHLGGLSSATYKVLPLFDYAQKDFVLIETVGVGQSETEIMEISDLTLLVLNPQTGDEIQILKAGIMEIADIYIVNKADLDGAERTLQDLKSFFALSGINPPALLTSARTDLGIKQLTETIFLEAERLASRNKARSEYQQRKLLKKLVLEKTEHLLERIPEWKSYSAQNADPFSTADEIFRRIINDKKN